MTNLAAFACSMCLAFITPEYTMDAAPDLPFAQEYREWKLLEGAANDVWAVAVESDGRAWAATQGGLYVCPSGGGDWQLVENPKGSGPALCAEWLAGELWVGAWNGLFRASAEGMKAVAGVDGPVAAVALHADTVVAMGPGGRWFVDAQGGAEHDEPPVAGSVRGMVEDGSGALWVATANGLFRQQEGAWRTYLLEDEIISANLGGIALGPRGRVWAGGLGGLTVYADGELDDRITPAEGLPSAEVRSVALGPDGRMWVGTALGVARYDGRAWSLRHSRRWLPSDDVRDVAFAPDGAAWVATAEGVSVIRGKTMTLADKAAYFHEQTMERHVRPPFIVEKCRLPKPGDTSEWLPEDDDNDGGYTANYLVAECFRYAATQSEEARANAKKAFDCLHMLQTITETSGFFARTVAPAGYTRMHDPNRTYTPQEIAVRRVLDPRYKPVEQRWRPSSDGQWLWKGDTSSDEVTSHFFGYLFYHELVADAAEKARVAALARRIMDYIIDNGYVFMDMDGTHTRWGVWAPERLNHDPDWRAERGVNSAEILSFLKVTHHMTGDPKYQHEYERLLFEHDYAGNVRNAKTFEKAWRTHIDDELLVQTFPGLILLEKDPALARLYQQSMDRWYAGVRHEQNAFFNTMYGYLTGQDPEREDTLFLLRDVPLDRVNWRISQREREDVRLVRAPIYEQWQVDRILPPSERATIRWDKNPWEAVLGDGGHTEWAPTFWLLPYWIARYCGFVSAPAE